MKKVLPLFIILILLLNACNLPGMPTGAPTDGSAAAPAENQPASTESPPTPAEVQRVPPRMPPSVAAQPAASIIPTQGAPSPVMTNNTLVNIGMCKLPVRTVFKYKNDADRLGVPRDPGFVKSIGTVEVVVLFFDFPDARATRTPEEALTLFTTARASQLFEETSYGRLNVVFKPEFRWVTISQPLNQFVEKVNNDTDEQRPFIEEVVKLAGANVDFSKTDVLMLVGNPDADYGSKSTTYMLNSDISQGSQRISANGYSISGALLQLVNETAPVAQSHKNNFIAKNVARLMTLPAHGFLDTAMYPGLSQEQVASATGIFSQMGHSLYVRVPGFFAFERWQLGWLDDEQIVCQTASDQTTQLSALENPGGTKVVMVPLAERLALVVESRRAIGVDQALGKAGALVYLVDTSRDYFQAPIQVLPALDNDLSRSQSPLAQGETFSYCNITITNVTAGTDGDTVRVTIPDQINCPPEQTAGHTLLTAQNLVAASQNQPQATATAPTFACDANLVPAPANAPVTVRFINQSGLDGIGFWQDTSGPLQQYFTLPNATFYDQETYPQHKWVIQDATGATLSEYIASSDMRQCVLMKPPLGALWIDFVNQSGVPAVGYLVKPDGSLEEYFQVGVGGTAGLWTANGVAWQIIDKNGNVLLQYTSTNAPTQSVVIPPLIATPTVVAQNTVAPLPTNTPAPTTTPAPTSTPAVVIAINPATNCPIIPGASEVVCYDITGSTESELRASMDQLRPKDPFNNNKPVDALTIWYVSWEWPGYGTNQCDLTRAKVTLTEVKITFPRWNAPANADPGLVAKWNAYIQNLAIHEQGHVDNIVNNYPKIKTAIQNATCSTAEAAVQGALVPINEFDNNYDLQTNHGRTQGAVFP